MSIPAPVPFTPTKQERKAQPLPSAFEWRDPATLPPRPWVYGRHLIRKQVSVTVAPGGVGKSSLTIVEALAMASGRQLLDEWTAPNLRVWMFNLEDPTEELDRRIMAAMLHHQVSPAAIEGRLFRDSGRDRSLCVAVQTRNGTEILKPAFDELAEQITALGIDVVIVDPFVSCHQASENDNGAIDLVAKEWARLADRCNCAIELVHHTRKTNGAEASTEDARGATALLGAARSGRVLNRMGDKTKADAGLKDDPATYFSVDRDKANLAPIGKRVWRRMATYRLPNGDDVGVAVAWEMPDDFDGVSVADLLKVQHAVDGKDFRESPQARDWAGNAVADVLGLDAKADKGRITRLLRTWVSNGALSVVKRADGSRHSRPFIEVGEWATA